MPEDPSGAGAPPTDTPQDQKPAAGAAAPPSQPPADPDPPKPRTDSANRRIKDFADQRGITVEALLDQFTDLENKGKTEFQRLEGERDTFKSEAETYKQRFREVNARVALTQAVNQIPNVLDAETVVDLAVPHLEYDKNGDPTNIEAVIETLRERKPKLFPAAQGSGDGGAGGAANTRDINTVLREMARGGT